ncbi:MAG: DMT family transporter [Hyphomicrobiaceae bacterium]|nr:DMT family transporter [Hyphomicrobiaceae bacterium]
MTAVPHAYEPVHNLRGIFAMVVAMAAFVGNDACVKLAAQELPTGEVIFLRGLATVALCLGLIIARDTPRVIVDAIKPKVALRALCDVGGAFTFLFTLTHMPIADAYAILQFTPLALTAAAAVFLGAKVGWRRWSAAIIGLVGVLIIVRPGGNAFNAYALLALVSVFFSVTRDLITRSISLGVTSLAMTFASTTMVALASTGFVLLEAWRTPSLAVGGLVICAAVLLIAGQHFLILALRTGEIAVVAPFRYSIVLWSVLAGLGIWQEFPDGGTLIGLGIVTGAGLYTFLREQKLSRMAGA